MTTLAIHFRTILSGLQAGIAAFAALRSENPAHAARDRARTALLVLVWGRVGRMVTRFDTLFARWRANTSPNRTLPKPRRSRAGAPSAPRAKLNIPNGRAWLVVVMGYEAAGRACQLQHLLARPDLAEFLLAAPQAGRILRPLCHMLGIDPPLQPTLPDPQHPPTRTPARQPRPPADTPHTGARAPRQASPTPPLRFSRA